MSAASCLLCIGCLLHFTCCSLHSACSLQHFACCLLQTAFSFSDDACCYILIAARHMPIPAFYTCCLPQVKFCLLSIACFLSRAAFCMLRAIFCILLAACFSECAAWSTELLAAFLVPCRVLLLLVLFLHVYAKHCTMQPLHFVCYTVPAACCKLHLCMQHATRMNFPVDV
jgi:hypothetical protein